MASRLGFARKGGPPLRAGPPFLDPPCRSGWCCAQAWRCVCWGGAVARWSGVRRVRRAGEFTGSEEVSLVLAWLVGRALRSGVVCRR